MAKTPECLKIRQFRLTCGQLADSSPYKTDKFAEEFAKIM